MMARSLSAQSGIAEGARLLAAGGLVAFPTETVYGLGANAVDAHAVARVFEAKRRPYFDPLIVHVASVRQMDSLVRSVSAIARDAIDAFWPGPLTLVFPRDEMVPPIVSSGLDTVAVRLPAHPVAVELIRQAGVPVAAPSANPFGQLSPTRASHVEALLGDAIDLIIDGGPAEWGLESTIVDVSGDVVRLVRLGAVSVEQLEVVFGDLEPLVPGGRPTGPGQLAHHYAPRTPMYFVDDFVDRLAEDNEAPGDIADVGYLAFCQAPQQKFAVVEVLSPQGDLREAAAELFAALHRLDAAGVRSIYAERMPEVGLGRAINDRLQRAVATFAVD